MASANLQVSPKFQALFEQAQSEAIRWIQVKIDDVTFEVTNSGKSGKSLEADLVVVQQALDKDACMVLVCIDEQSTPKKWIVVAYVPETSQVKKRMLYASGRQDIKMKLGQQYFRGEVHCGEKADLTASNVLREKTEYEDLAYTDAEVALKEDHAASARPGEKHELGMKTLDFPLEPTMAAALDEFHRGVVNWVACRVGELKKDGNEHILLVEKCVVPADLAASVQGKIELKEPRFYLVRRVGTPVGDQTYLVFSCPENSQIKLRMVYSTCKASLLEAASLGGVSFRLLEIRSPDELDDLFVREETVDEDAGKIIHQDIVKPRGPGRRPKQ